MTHTNMTVFVVLSELMPDRRRTVASTYLRIVNVTRVDSQVLQCNASNNYGYVFANAYLNVIGQQCLSQSSFCLLAPRNVYVER